MKKNTLYLALLLTPLTLYPSEETEETFNLSEELNKTANNTNTPERLDLFQNMAQHITKADSTRLSKKLVKLIKNLHTLCYDDEDPAIKLSYKKLLETTIANEKLNALDYTGELSRLLFLYTPSTMDTVVEGDVREEILAEESEPKETVEEIIEEVVEVDPVEERRNKLYENIQNIDKEAITSKLTLRRILKDLTTLTRDFKAIESEVSRLSDQNETMTLIYKKLLNIERAIRLNSGETFRSPVGITESIISPEILEEYEDFYELSPFVQRLILLDSID